MACVSSTEEMTAAERECCNQMAQQCGSMGMPASHSCCQTEVRQPQSMLLSSNTQVTQPVLAHAVIHPDLGIHGAEPEFVFFHLHPPPESPPGCSSILRI